MSILSDENLNRREFIRLMPGVFATVALTPLMFSGQTMRAMSVSGEMAADLGQVADPVIQHSYDLGAI